MAVELNFSWEFHIFLLFSLSLIIIFLMRNTKRKRLPPGPTGWPLVGNLFSLGETPHLKICEWTEQYGDIFSFKIGLNRVIIMSDPKMIRECFTNPNFSGRPDLESFNILSGGKNGIIWADGPQWAEQRRFALKHLREFGKNGVLESLIMTEVTEYLNWLTLNEGETISMTRQFSLAVLNSLWMMLAGKRYNHDDPQLIKIFEQNANVAEQLRTSTAVFMPSLAKLIPDWSGWTQIMEMIEDMIKVCKENVLEHQKNFLENGEKIQAPRDFIEAYLNQISIIEDPKSTFYKEHGVKSLLAVITDMLDAGSDMTSITLSWSILYLTKFPWIQTKLQEELDRVIGPNRSVALSDRPNLPYSLAVMEEVHRMASIMPVGVFHTAMTNCQFHGYDIDKGTWFLPNLFYLHHSNDIWADPQTFIPERHLSDHLKLNKNPALQPFSIGLRTCLGEFLARDTFFLFLTNIFHKFHIQLSIESTEISLNPKPGFLLPPQDFKVVVRER